MNDPKGRANSCWIPLRSKECPKNEDTGIPRVKTSEDERRQKEGGEDERSEDGGVNFCRSESESPVQEASVSERADCYARVRARSGLSTQYFRWLEYENLQSLRLYLHKPTIT